MARIEITEGWTGPVDLQLQADGAVYNLTGATVALIKCDACGVEWIATTSGSQFEQVSSTCGIVRYTPSTGDLLVAGHPYLVKVRVTSGSAKVYFPNGAGDEWTVFSQ
jgi:hypothetical protein